jgi:hypothetical protein
MPQTIVDEIVRQTLRDVLAANDEAASQYRACFYREQMLREHLWNWDLVLHEACRDIVAPVITAKFGGWWRVDRVHYPGVDLPSGELGRSTGHWNPLDQWEVFEVERGEVMLLVRKPGPGRPIELVHCAAGSVVVLRPGAWHLTYAPAGPASVSNAYTSALDGGHDGKYFSRRSTVRCGLYRDGGRVAVYQPGADTVIRRIAQPRQAMLPGLPALAELFGVGCDPEAVARFEESVTRFEEYCARHP